VNSDIRSKLDMGDRVHAFSVGHPFDDPGQMGLVTRLGDRLERAHTLGALESTGHRIAQAAVDNKDDIRALIHEDLRVLSSIAELVAIDVPGLSARLALPLTNASHLAFLNETRAMVGQAEQLREVFLTHGMPPGLIGDINAKLARYTEAVVEKGSGVVTHVGANAELEEVTGEVMIIVNALDRLNAVRYRKNPDLLAAWKSAREVVGPAARSRREEETPGGEVGGVEEPAA
jgi:hypothetical protein